MRQAAGIPLSKFSPHVQLTTEPGKFQAPLASGEIPKIQELAEFRRRIKVG